MAWCRLSYGATGETLVQAIVLVLDSHDDGQRFLRLAAPLTSSGSKCERLHALSLEPHNNRLNPPVGSVTGLAKDARPAPVPPAG